MANSEKRHHNQSADFHRIDNDYHFHDVFAEITGVTEYNVDGVHFVNLSFFSHRVAPFADETGRPARSKIDVKRVASITLTHDKAVALRDALTANLGDSPRYMEKENNDN